MKIGYQYVTKIIKTEKMTHYGGKVGKKLGKVLVLTCMMFCPKSSLIHTNVMKCGAVAPPKYDDWTNICLIPS